MNYLRLMKHVTYVLVMLDQGWTLSQALFVAAEVEHRRSTG